MKGLLIIATVVVNGMTCFGQTNAEFLYKAASNAFCAHHYDVAVSNLDQEIALSPLVDQAFCLRGMSKYWLRDYRGAILDYDKAVELNPKRGGYYCNRGQARFALQQFEMARSDFDKAIAMDPTMAIAYFNRGQLRADVDHDFANAILDFSKAINLRTDPEEADLFFYRAKAEMELKKFQDAVADYGKVLQLQPTFPSARTNLAAAKAALRKSHD